VFVWVGDNMIMEDNPMLWHQQLYLGCFPVVLRSLMHVNMHVGFFACCCHPVVIKIEMYCHILIRLYSTRTN
jgi:hypothetical protein